jgi:hypothetical protein
MTIEIRQLIIRAVVPATPPPADATTDSELVARCTRAVLRHLERLKDR